MPLDIILRNLLAHSIAQHPRLRYEPALDYAQTMYWVYKLEQYNGQSLRLSTCDIPTCNILDYLTWSLSLASSSFLLYCLWSKYPLYPSSVLPSIPCRSLVIPLLLVFFRLPVKLYSESPHLVLSHHIQEMSHKNSCVNVSKSETQVIMTHVRRKRLSVI